MGEFVVKLTLVLNVLASAGYFFDGNIWKGLYWLAAAVLTTSTMYMK